MTYIDSDYEDDDLPDPDSEEPALEVESEICPACNGSGEGRYDGSTCSNCRGTGEVRC